MAEGALAGVSREDLLAQQAEVSGRRTIELAEREAAIERWRGGVGGRVPTAAPREQDRNLFDAVFAIAGPSPRQALHARA